MITKQSKVWFVENKNHDKTIVQAFNENHVELIVKRIFDWSNVNIREANGNDFSIYGDRFNINKIINYNGEFDNLLN